MKKHILFWACLIYMIIHHSNLNAQSVFNDTILYRITNAQFQNNHYQSLVQFISMPSANSQNLSGQGVLSVSATNCDSIWDVWPDPFVNWKKAGVLKYHSAHQGGNLGPGPHQGRITFLKEVNGVLEENDFYVNFTFTILP